MATTTRTIDARAETLRALREGRELDELQQLIARDQLQTRRPGTHLDALLALSVDAYALTQASREATIPMAGLIETYLAEYHFHGKVDHRNLHYALTYPALVHAGLQPDLDGDLYYWRSELWPYVLHAITAYLRIAAERTGRQVRDLAHALPD